MTIQFICRGNAYRSIMAEAYLRSLGLPNINVISSGTAASEHKQINMSNYPLVLGVLKKYGIDGFAKDHFADDLDKNLVASSDIVVCMNKRVLDEATTLCELPAKTYVWDISDFGENGIEPSVGAARQERMEIVYKDIVSKVDELVKLNGLATNHTLGA